MSCLAALCLVGTIAIDGDTLRYRPGPNIRIWGIDAPEMRDPGGRASRDTLAAIIAGQTLACDPVDVDRYGRTVAVCRLPNGADLACLMVAAGQARDWPKYSGGAYAKCGRR